MEFLAFLIVPFVMLGIFAAPELIGSWASQKETDALRQARQHHEIERKLAIADAARAARERGEAFVPPADYDR